MRKALLLSALFSTQFYYSSAQIRDYISTIDLVGWWPFTSGFTDSSNVTNLGAGINFIFVPDRFGNGSNACKFTNSYSYVGLSDIHANTGEDYTISYWIKLDSYEENDVLMDFHPSFHCYALPTHIEMSDSIYLLKCNDTTSKVSFGHKDVFLNNWKMVTQVSTPDTTYIYVDDELKVAKPFSWISYPVNKLVVGNKQTDLQDNDRAINGTVDDVAVWTRRLSQCEISSLFHASNSLITGQPIDMGTTFGGSVSFAISDVGGPASYQWEENDGSALLL